MYYISSCNKGLFKSYYCYVLFLQFEKSFKIQVKEMQVVTTNPFIYCNVSSAAAPIFKQSIFFCKFTKKVQVYQCKNTLTKNNKIQLIIMDIIQSYCTLSNKNNGAELIFSFNAGLSGLINKLSLISNKDLLVP